MISKERLEELIEQGATIYEVKYNTINPVSLKIKIKNIDWKYNIITFDSKIYTQPEERYLHHKYLKNLFETKEEAEFVSKFYTSKTLYFRPPTFEEFLKTRQVDVYWYWYCGDISIIMEEDNKQKGLLKSKNKFTVDNGYNFTTFYYEYNEYWDNRKEVYYEALEYAQKLFLGEENNDDNT